MALKIRHWLACGVAFAALPNVAQAQQTAANSVETVVVTGSRVISDAASSPTRALDRACSSMPAMAAPTKRLTASTGAMPGALSGRQRRHGRKPASCAEAAEGKNVTFFDCGVRAGQIGRQYMPVVLTPVKKRPSNRTSRNETAR